jgi:hypothetical protein
MPRAKKTMSGNNPQKIQAVQGQTYGEGVRQENLQKTLPAPQSPEISAPTAEATGQPQQEMPAPRPQSFEQIAAQVRGAGNLLRQPDDRPDLPVTDGIATGPGRGPETLGRSTQLGNTLRRLALQTNDPIFTELATKVGL